MKALAVSILLGAGTMPSAAIAQGLAQRHDIERVRAELAEMRDTTTLVEREQALIQLARVHRDSTLLHLELGFLAYRLGELSGSKRRYEDAASEFEWAAELEPDWPYGWYGLGLAELALGEHSVLAIENIRQMLGKDYLSRAATAFARAARLDPAFAAAVVDLARTAMQQRIRPRLEIARQALREAAATSAAASPALQLARGRVEREAGEGDSAVAAFHRYLTVGGDSGVGLLELSRSFFFLRRLADGSASWYRGAAEARSAEARALYRADLAWIATPAELAAFDSAATGPAMATWAERFWAQRDAGEGRRPGERLAEHYRRYFHVMRNYRLVSRHRQYDVTEQYRSEQNLVDDRGVVYFRHGEPDRRATYSSPAVEPNESWQYLGPDRNLIFHFVARGDVNDYKLVESLADAYGMRQAVAAAASGNASFAAGLFESRSEMDPVYRRLGSPTSSSSHGPALSQERTRGRLAIESGTRTDSYRLSFERDLQPLARVIALGGPEPGEATLLVPFAVRGSSLTPFTHAGTWVYPVNVRVVLERADGVIHSVDTVRIFSVPRPLAGQEQLNGLIATRAGPGRYLARVVLAQPEADAGAVLPRDTVVVPAFHGPATTLSDIVIGRRGEGPQWIVGADTVPVTAAAIYPQGAVVELYYQVHGLPRGRRYDNRVEVIEEGRRRFLGVLGGNRNRISLAFEGTAEGTVTPVRQTVNLASLKAGKYRLRVTVTPGGDPAHTREVLITIH